MKGGLSKKKKAKKKSKKQLNRKQPELRGQERRAQGSPAAAGAGPPCNPVLGPGFPLPIGNSLKHSGGCHSNVSRQGASHS